MATMVHGIGRVDSAPGRRRLWLDGDGVVW